jgi:GT2 family glycosyltransferase
MTREPKINVVIPTCNRSDLLRFSLQSALSQDYAEFRCVLNNSRLIAFDLHQTSKKEQNP